MHQLLAVTLIQNRWFWKRSWRVNRGPGSGWLLGIGFWLLAVRDSRYSSATTCGISRRRCPMSGPTTCNLMDLGLYKNFQLPNRVKLQIRIEAINALNYTVLWNPNVDLLNATFEFINQDRNNPRDIQIGARFTF